MRRNIKEDNYVTVKYIGGKYVVTSPNGGYSYTTSSLADAMFILNHKAVKK